MLIKIKRKDAFDRYPKFPWHNYETDEWYFPRDCKNGILTLSSNSMEEHAEMLSSSIIKLMNAFNADSLIFLGETEMPWLRQRNDFQPLKTAQAYLKENKVGQRFDGALDVSIADMNEFIGHLLGFARCRWPIIHFMDKEQSMVGNICKYGSMHYCLLKEEITELFEKAIGEGDFKPQHHISYDWPFKLKDT